MRAETTRRFTDKYWDSYLYCVRGIRERKHDLPGMGVSLLGRAVGRVQQASPATKQCGETMGSGALAH